MPEGSPPDPPAPPPAAPDPADAPGSGPAAAGAEPKAAPVGDGDPAVDENATTAKRAAPPKVAPAVEEPPERDHHGPSGRLVTLALAALGVVYGDIGTSPLYAVKECLTSKHAPPLTEPNVLGVLSLIFWSLMMVVTVKYLTFIMRADNRGEGGILALLALVPSKIARGKGRIGLITFLVIIGAALLYGDGIITPAISVLSAIEGLEVATTKLKPAVVPLTCVVLFGLFWVQRRGTETVGRIFGPIMVIWFATIAGLGIWQLVGNPAVLKALWPGYAVEFFLVEKWKAFVLLGSVVLAVTGGEALYADMGHFGLRPIRLSWLTMVLPALLLSYLGQGALLLTAAQQHRTIENPFFAQVPEGGFTIALSILATIATVIASQALISGAFSLTHQAVQLGLFPRVTVRHTSRDTEGQIYIPEINWALAIGCLALVLSFREAERLAAAYGLAVTGTMGITSIIFYVVARSNWGWSRWKALPLLILFLGFDLPFFFSNLLKFFDGGFVPIAIGAVIATSMVIWRLGKVLLYEHIQENVPPLEPFLAQCNEETATLNIVPGTAVFMASTADKAPPALLHLVRRVHARPERLLLLTVEVTHDPYVAFKDRIVIDEVGDKVHHIVVRYGFMQQANVPDIVALVLRRLQVDVPLTEVTYYLGRETFLATNQGKMGQWSESIFSFLVRNAKTATSYFQIPPNQVVEIGTQIDL